MSFFIIKSLFSYLCFGCCIDVCWIILIHRNCCNFTCVDGYCNELRFLQILYQHSRSVNSNLSSWIGVECWCNFGATLYRAILTISNGVLKTRRDNFDFVEYKNAPIFRSIFYYLFDELGCNEICRWQNKSTYVDEIAIAMKSDFVGLWWQISYHPRLASDFIWT